MKIVINTCYGGFDLSEEAVMFYAELANIKLTVVKAENDWYRNYYIDGIIDNDHYFWTTNISRNDPHLVHVVEVLRAEASGSYSRLKVVEIPDDVDWEINEYDGLEHIREKSRTWF